MSDSLQQFIDSVHGKVSRGKGEEAYRMMAEAATQQVNLPLRRAAGMLLLRYGHYGEPALSCMEAVAAIQPKDPQVLHVLAMLQWARDQGETGPTSALDTARRLVTLAPDQPGALTLLGRIALSARQYQESYLAFAAAAATQQQPAAYGPQRLLASSLMRGVGHVAFTLDEITYTFGLAVHTTQAIESSIVHCAGQLTEIQELRYLKSVLDQVDVIVEVGVLLANHSSFFLHNLRPKRLYLFEADPTMLPEIQKNTALNNKNGTEIILRQVFIGADGGDPIDIMGNLIPQRSLSGMVSEHVDFLKVDTDGGELPFLIGAEELIMTSRPFVMMETDTVTDAPVQEWFSSRGYARQYRVERGNYFNNFFRHEG